MNYYYLKCRQAHGEGSQQHVPPSTEEPNKEAQEQKDDEPENEPQGITTVACTHYCDGLFLPDLQVETTIFFPNCHNQFLQHINYLFPTLKQGSASI